MTDQNLSGMDICDACCAGFCTCKQPAGSIVAYPIRSDRAAQVKFSMFSKGNAANQGTHLQQAPAVAFPPPRLLSGKEGHFQVARPCPDGG